MNVIKNTNSLPIQEIQDLRAKSQDLIKFFRTRDVSSYIDIELILFTMDIYIEIGAFLVAIGLGLTLFGMMMLFERNCLRLGNVSYVTDLLEEGIIFKFQMCLIFGILLLVGPNRIKSYFLQTSRMQATIIVALGKNTISFTIITAFISIIYFKGIFLVFYGKPRLGILMEIFGLLNLFG